MSTKGNRLKKFFSFYKPYRGLFAADVICAIIVAAISLLYPMLIRYITKDVVNSGFNVNGQLYATGGAMLALIIIQTACALFYDYKGHQMGAKMERDMRNEIFAQYQKLSFSFYDKEMTGRLMSRVTNDIYALAELFHHGPEDLVIYMVKFIGATVLLFNINSRLMLTICAFLPVMLIYALFFNGKLKVAYKVNNERIADINAQLEDSLSGVRVVKTFANEDVEMAKFSKENEKFQRSRSDIYKNEALYYTGLTVFFAQLITVAVIVFGGASIARTTLDLPDLIAFLLYVGYLMEPITQLANTVQMYQERIAGFNRFMEIMELTPEIQDAPDAEDIGVAQGKLDFENVGFKYENTRDYVLRNVSLSVEQGEYVALVGTSGVGKTTLCSLISRFYEVSEGSIKLDGRDIRNISIKSLRKNIGVVQQDVYLFAGTVMENILYGKPGASEEEVIQAAKNANAHEFIMDLPNGYNTDIGQRGVRLSGGQKQRLSIARVFLKNPPVLIFDEATSALDSESEKVVRDSLDKLAKNRTTFVIAHRLSTIRNAERIIVLAEQGVDEQGSHEELIASGGVYARLYAMQFDVE